MTKLADQLNLDAQRIVRWAFFQAVLGAWWTIEDGGRDWDTSIAAARVLLSATEVASMKSALARRAGKFLIQVQDRALFAQLLLKFRDHDIVQHPGDSLQRAPQPHPQPAQ